MNFKVQVRQGCFETNSSSTHSLQVVQGSLDDAYKKVKELIEVAYYDKSKQVSNFMPEDYFIDNYDGTKTLVIKDLGFNDSCEDNCVYVICYNWMAKIQYIGMLLWQMQHYTPEQMAYSKEEFKRFPYESYEQWKRVENSEEYKEFSKSFPSLTMTKTFKVFEEIVTKYAKEKKNIIVSNIVFDLEEGVYFENTEGEDYFSEAIFNNPKLFKEKLIELIYNDNLSMIYCDEAYSPYEPADITVH